MTQAIPLYTAVENLAIFMGAKTLSGGINWDWANGFPSQAAAECFIQNLPPGYETRGVYRDNPYMTEHSVRYR